MDENYAQLWQKLSAALKPQVSPDTFKRWFSAVKLVQATDDAFTFRVPNNIYQFWIESNHMAALQAAIVTAFGAPRKVKFSSRPKDRMERVSPKFKERNLPERIRGTPGNPATRSDSTRETVSNRLSSGRTTRSHTRRASRSPSHRRELITRSSFTAGWDWAKRI